MKVTHTCLKDKKVLLKRRGPKNGGGGWIADEAIPANILREINTFLLNFGILGRDVGALNPVTSNVFKTILLNIIIISQK